MKHDIKLILRLILRKIQYKKKHYFIYVGILFISCFLVTSLFLSRDVFHTYQKNSVIAFDGNWNINYSPALIKESNITQEEFLFIEENLQIVRKEIMLGSIETNENIDFLTIPVYGESAFNDSLPIHLIEGEYPSNHSEVVINKTYLENNDLHVGDFISYMNYSNEKIKSKIVGIYDGSISNAIYTNVDSGAKSYDKVYATFKDRSTYEYFLNESLSGNTLYELNHDLNSYMYPSVTTIDYMAFGFAGFIALALLVLVLNILEIVLIEEKEYYQLLFELGANKIFIFGFLFFEFFVLGILACITGFIFTLGLAGLGIFLIKQLLDFSFLIYLEFSISLESILFIIFLFLALLIIILSLACHKAYKKKKQKRIFKIRINKSFPVSFQLSIVDYIRRAEGIVVVFVITILMIIVSVSQIMVYNRIQTFEENYSYTVPLSVTMDFFDSSPDKIETVINQFNTILNKENVEYNYDLESSFKLQIDGVQADSKVLTVSNLSTIKEDYNIESDLPILIFDANNINQVKEVELLSQDNELSKSIDFINLGVEEGELSSFNCDYALIVSFEQMKEWLMCSPDDLTSLHVNVYGENVSRISNVLSKELQTDETQKLYIYENQSSYMKFKQDSYVLRGLSIIVIGVLMIFSLAIVKNINRQYLYNHREDVKLLYYLGLSKTQIRRIYLFQSLFLYFVSLLANVIIMLVVFSFFNNYLMNMNHFFINFMIFNLILIVSLCIMTFHNFKSVTK